MEKLRVGPAVIVEGKYDKIKLSSVIDGLIIPLDGFRIYKDREKTAMLRAVAQKQGVILLTDSDRAGFRLRGYLKNILQGAKITQLYIPQVKGKEKRKTAPGREGLLGVEGIDTETLRKLFETAAGAASPAGEPVTRMDFYDAGLAGGANAARKRRLLLERLGLPSYLSANGLLEAVNFLMTREEFLAFVREREE